MSSAHQWIVDKFALNTQTLAAVLVALVLSACANTPGDDLPCPVCNNTTEVLVGRRCVPISEVEACGPDGHLHDTACHCFSGQSPTRIHGIDYCLQPACIDPSSEKDGLSANTRRREADFVLAIIQPNLLTTTALGAWAVHPWGVIDENK